VAVPLPRQGDLWEVQLVGKNRPGDREKPHHIRLVAIVTTDLYNEYGLAYLVAPVLPWSDKRGNLPTNLVLDASDAGTLEKSIVFTTQMRPIAPWRLVRLAGKLPPAKLDALRETLRVTFDI